MCFRTFLYFLFVGTTLLLKPDFARASDLWKYSFNSGLGGEDAVNDAKENGVLEQVPMPGGGYKIRFLRIESLERSKISSREQQTLFCFGEAAYHPVLSGEMPLQSVTLHYIWLDYEGRLPKDGGSWKLAISAEGGGKPTISAGPGAKAFHDSLPAWTRSHLHLVSGYLEKNPGRPVILFQRTQMQDAVWFWGNILGVLPGSGLFKNAVGEVFENAGKQLTVEGLKKMAASDELQWGSDYRVRDAEILQHRADFEKAGEAMWKF